MIDQAEPTDEPQGRFWFRSRVAVVLFSCAAVAAPVIGFCASIALLPHVDGTLTSKSAEVGHSPTRDLDIKTLPNWPPDLDSPPASQPAASLRFSAAAAPHNSNSNPNPSRSGHPRTPRPAYSPSQAKPSPRPHASPSGSPSSSSSSSSSGSPSTSPAEASPSANPS